MANKCASGKKPYPTLQAAKAAAAQLADKRARQGNPVVSFLRAYGCACGKFHFGSSRVIDWDRVKQHTQPPAARGFALIEILAILVVVGWVLTRCAR